MLGKLVGGSHIIQGTYMSEFATKKLDVPWPWLSTVRNIYVARLVVLSGIVVVLVPYVWNIRVLPFFNLIMRAAAFEQMYIPRMIICSNTCSPGGAYRVAQCPQLVCWCAWRDGLL